MASFKSSAPYFKAALKSRLETVAALRSGTTLISRGNPYPKSWGGEAIIIGAVSNRTREFACGMTQCNEEYDLELAVNVAGSPQNPHEDYEARAYELADAVEESIISWTRDGSTLVSGAWGHVDVALVSEGSDQEGMKVDSHSDVEIPTARDATVILTVHVMARLLGA
jgi:hypothetical protein